MVFNPLLGLKNTDFRPMPHLIDRPVVFRYFAVQQNSEFIPPILEIYPDHLCMMLPGSATVALKLGHLSASTGGRCKRHRSVVSPVFPQKHSINIRWMHKKHHPVSATSRINKKTTTLKNE
jgi:hypothetical protein